LTNLSDDNKLFHMKISVDKDKCIGCGACTAVAPKSFRLGEDGKAEVITPPGDKNEVIESAAQGCPVEAIKIEK
jgi:ferredoxin